MVWSAKSQVGPAVDAAWRKALFIHMMGPALGMKSCWIDLVRHNRPNYRAIVMLRTFVHAGVAGIVRHVKLLAMQQLMDLCHIIHYDVFYNAKVPRMRRVRVRYL